MVTEMDRSISINDKFDLQQNFRRFIKFQDQFETLNEQTKTAKASRVWIVGIVAIFFAMGSEFFLGVAAGLLALYFYRIMKSWIKQSQAAEGREIAERWFHNKGLKFEGRVLYFNDDQMLEKPLDPFNDGLYS